MMEEKNRKKKALTTAPLQSLAQGSMFWQPDHMEPSPWLDHLPWIFWLLEAIAPRCCITLGASSEGPHLAFCQGVARLNLDSECLLISSEPAAEDIASKAERRYGAIHRRLGVAPFRASRQFESEVDILALNLAPDNEDLEDILDRWLVRLSERGVVLLSGINHRDQSHSVYRLFSSLQAKYRSVTFHHGDGLGVVMVGEHPPELIEALLARWNVPTAARAIREIFARLGRACADQALAEQQAAHLRNADDQLKNMAQERDERIATITQLQARVKERDDALQNLESDKLHLAEESADAQRKAQSLQAELTQAQVRLSEMEISRSEQEKKLKEFEKIIGEKDDNIQARFRELATMTSMAEEADQQKRAGEKEIGEFRQMANSLQEELALTRQQLADMETAQKEQEQHQKELEQTIKEKDDNIQTRFRELATMTNLAEESDKKKNTAESRAKIYYERNEEKKQEAKALRKRVRDLEKSLSENEVSLESRFHEMGELTAAIEAKDKELEALRGEGVGRSHGRGDKGGSSVAGGLFSLSAVSNKSKTRKQQESLKALEASEWFDAVWYLEQYKDIASDPNYSRNPALHYLKFGGFEGRDPSPHFDSAGYLEAYPDVALTGINPLLHFIRDGMKEGREPRP